MYLREVPETLKIEKHRRLKSKSVRSGGYPSTVTHTFVGGRCRRAARTSRSLQYLERNTGSWYFAVEATCSSKGRIRHLATYCKGVLNLRMWLLLD